MDLKKEIYSYGEKAKEAALRLAIAPSKQKNESLKLMAKNLRENIPIIIEENKKDLEDGKKNGLSPYMLDRLMLNDKRIEEMAKGIEKIVTLTDPVGATIKGWVTEDGIQIRKVSVPIGVVGMIYESRPNVTADAVSLAIKSGNAIILRGGKEAINSNRIIAKLLKYAVVEAGLPEGSLNLIQSTDREGVKVLVQMKEYLDVIIPRGGESLINAVVENAKVPVIYHDKGLCHTFVDEYADIEKARKICINAKVQRPSVCNAMETMLVHKNIAEKFLPIIADDFQKAKVELRGCEETLKILPDIKHATEEDWNTEYLSLILSVKVVNTVDEAINHINKYGSKHSDAIVTENYSNAQKFQAGVDAATVYVNASTRFTDGGMFGFGAEIGISTNKLHARGPFALEELTTYKYLIDGDGHIRG